jgi:hypothetical protein
MMLQKGGPGSGGCRAIGIRDGSPRHPVTATRGSRLSIREVHETNKKRRSVALPPTLLRLIATKQRPAAKPAFVFLRESRNYFLGAIASFAALATRNFTTVFALI